jgi:diguanylate cyclase (GGDEF)-like protein
MAQRTTSRVVWMFVAALLGASGAFGAVLIADSFAHRDAAISRAAFARSSAEVASTLELALAGDESLVISARAFVHGNPKATSAQFTQWIDDVRAYARYPELRGAWEVVIVTAAELPAFAARVAVDFRPRSEPSGGPFQLVPPGDRPFYCLAGMNNVAAGVSQPPAGYDYCEDPLGRAEMVASRDSGEGSYEPTPTFEGSTWLVQQVPIYRDGTVPATIEARQAAFLGGFAVLVDPQVVLSRALQGHPGMSVSMRYQAGLSDVEFASGVGGEGVADATIDLHNGWTVRTFGLVGTGGVFTNGSALLVLAIGVALSLVVAVLVLVLGTGRARALRLVADRTEELRHQALHDALTGLPNRALIVDRIEQLLDRNRRRGTVGAAMFIDVDDFKNINDTLGHAAGDRLLVAVAARLTSALRGVDTIGRMGGDEFVVLIDGAQVDVDAAPELVARRLLDVMRQPFELDGSKTPISVNISIGIAEGDRAGGGELLRDADVALYEAKGAGKNRYEIYHPEMQTEISGGLIWSSASVTCLGNSTTAATCTG